MYLYFNKQGIPTTKIPHGQILRQGNDLNLYVCFPIDYKENWDGWILTVDLIFADGSKYPFELGMDKIGLKVFNKLKDSEITYDLKDGLEYFTFTRIIKDIKIPGDLILNFVLHKDEEPSEVLGSVTLFVEKTLTKKKQNLTIDKDQFDILEKEYHEMMTKYQILKDIKVDKTKENNIVYGRNNEEIVIPYSKQDGSPNSIVLRDENGRISNIEKPIENKDATNKEYVDKKIDDLIDSAPEELNTLNKIAKRIDDFGFKTIKEILSENEIIELWTNLEDGRYNITSEKYGPEILILYHTGNFFKRINGESDYSFNFIKNEWEILSGSAGSMNEIKGILSEKEIVNLWALKEQGEYEENIYTITSKSYGKELLIMSTQEIFPGETDDFGNPKDKRLFKRITGNFDYIYDFKENKWKVSSGGGSGGIVQLEPIGETNYQIAKGNELVLSFNFTPSSLANIKNGRAELYINGGFKDSKNIKEGEVVYPITEFIKDKVGYNEVMIKVIDSSGKQNAITYIVEVIELTLKSNFDDTIARKGNIEFRYTPSGKGTKKIIFLIDGEPYGEPDIVTSDNITQTKIFSFDEHKVYKLEVKAELTINDKTISSNILNYNLIHYIENETSILISSKFPTEGYKAKQGELINIDYVFYNPLFTTSIVNLKINDAIVEKDLIQNNEKRYYFASTDYPTGDVTFTIDINGISKTFTTSIEASDISVEPITTDLELYLNAKFRSNNEEENNRNHWKYEDIDAKLINFNWSTNGWGEDDKGNKFLRFNGKASTIIPFMPFEKNFLEKGKTIEIEFATKDVYDINKVLISCISDGIGFQITPNNCFIKGSNTTISTKFKEDEKIRITFVVQALGKLNLVKCLINGVVSGVAQYKKTDTEQENWAQTYPVGITINPNDGSIDIYNIRIYDTDLSDVQVLKNFIYDMNIIDKNEAYIRNNIIDPSTEEVSYALIKKLIPIMIITGEMPMSKIEGDDPKPKVIVKFENPFNPNNDFEYNDVEINVQGTSSKDFPRKNYKLKFKEKFSFYEGAIPEKTYTMKADYMESSHSHNTGNGIIMTKYSPQFPTQTDDNGVRNSIYGFPIVIFNKPTENSDLVYYGVFNFNNDKGNADTLGLNPEAIGLNKEDYSSCESWEFGNNISERCNFKTGDFTVGNWEEDFEARYHSGDEKDYTNLQKVIQWVANLNPENATNNELELPVELPLIDDSTKNKTYTHDTAEYRLASFKKDFEKHFDLQFSLFYYVMMDVILAADSRAKNMFLDTLNGEIWFPRWYDMDTAYGLDNEGNLRFSYNLEQNDIIESGAVYNGNESVLWNNFGLVFKKEINTFYNNLRRNKKLNYENLMSVLYNQQVSKISETMYNTDGQFKYIDILDPTKVDKIDSTRLYAEQGSRLNHLQWWLKNRIDYLDSKFSYDDYIEDKITWRSDSTGSYAVEPSSELKITPYISMYVSVQYGQNSTPIVERVYNKSSATIVAPSGTNLKNTETAIYGASKILKIEGIDSKYARTMDFHMASRLKELIIGNGTVGYKNTNLTSLEIGELKRLEKLDVQNCPNLTTTLDLSKCVNIKEIYAKGSGISGVILANGGNLQILELPATTVSLSLLNQPFLNDLSLEDYSKVKQLRIENCPLLNTKELLKSMIETVDFVRLSNVDWTINISEQIILDKLLVKGGLNADGSTTNINQPNNSITGKIKLTGEVIKAKLENWKIKLPQIEFNTDDAELVDVTCVVIFKNYLEENWKTVSVKYGESVVLDEYPEKPDDEKGKDYQFIGWKDVQDDTFYEGNIIPNVTKTVMNLIPQYTGTMNKYNVYWMNGDELLLQTIVTHGDIAVYNGSTPINGDYEFIGWRPNPIEKPIVEDTYFYARFNEPTRFDIEVSGTANPSITVKGISDTYNLVINWGDGTTDTYSLTKDVVTICTKTTSYSGDLFNPSQYVVTIPSSTEFEFYGEYLENQHRLFFDENNPEVKIVNARIVNTPFTAQQAFDNQPKLQTVEFENGITVIPAYCFANSGIQNFEVPEGVTRIGSNAFRNCGNLEKLIFPKSLIDFETFLFDSSTTKLEIYYKGTINDWCSINLYSPSTNNFLNFAKKFYIKNEFGAYYELIDGKISNIENINVGSFKSYKNLISLVVGTIVKNIESYAFADCAGLVNITLGKDITTINNYAFRNCTNLVSLQLGGSLKSIGSNCFNGCKNLKFVTVDQITPPSISSNTFPSTLEKIYVPAESVSTYQSASQWNAFSGKIEAKQS